MHDLVAKLAQVPALVRARLWPSRGRRQPLSRATQWRLVEFAHDNSSLIWANLIFVMGTALFASISAGSRWIDLWGAIGVVIGIARLAEQRRFWRSARGEWPTLSRWRFIAWSCCSGAHWSFAGLIFVVSDAEFPRFLATMTICAFVSNVTARNNPIPEAAIGPIVIALLPLALVCAASEDTNLRAFSLLVVFYGAVSIRNVLQLYQRNVQLITTDEENASLLLAVREANSRLATNNAALDAVAKTDELTGIANRRGFERQLANEWRRMERYGAGLGLLMIDIDHFKLFNDQFGHPAGDECLRQVAACISAAARRAGDFAARYGGEEFAVILPDVTPSGALVVGEAVRARVEALALAAPATAVSPKSIVTISVGVAFLKAEPHISPASLVKRADDQLYAAKAAGRNCVRGAVDADPA